ncbi:MAG: DUF559 domain-containing protein [Kineosporiaceae bacterium]|nr:DUF559 domain-containing protein [Kineosporiaceae bacterium]MBK7623680.1 DUF559 domain-containing protein [Kineosporiaceae bacterium]MBK8078025.1 DUF559 domain-containing protein [Kineosporiaceae bacterium]
MARSTARFTAAEAVHRLGGRAARADLLAMTTGHELRRALAAGEVVRAADGIYVLPGLSQARIQAAAGRGVVSHESAAVLWGIELVFPPKTVHVTIPRGARPPVRKGVVFHQRRLPDTAVRGDVTSLLQTVLDCCESLPFPQALAVADGALRLDPDLLDQLLVAAGRPGRGRARRAAVARHVSPLAANPFESAVRGVLIDAGIDGFRPQVVIDTPGGQFRVDLADEQRRIVIEADSFSWHGDRAALDRDCRRYDELVRAGWTVLRFSWEQVMFDGAWLVAVVRDVVKRAA